MTPGARLAALLEELPGDALLPASWIREQLAEEPREGTAANAGDTLPSDLTVKRFGAAFGKSASTARLWCERGQVPGAWKLNGRELRIPAGSIELYRRAQGAPAVSTVPPEPGDLADWRRRRKTGRS